jgi:hypothetical protein
VKTSEGGVELELKKISQWRWSGVEVETSGGGVEVEEEISNLGTLLESQSLTYVTNNFLKIHLL